VLAGHAPLVSAIRPGFITVFSGGKQERIIVTGGVAEVSEKGLTVLADIARTLEELDRVRLAEAIAEMEAKLAEKEGDELDRALARLDDFKRVQQQVSSTAMH
jgi:F-type H+-transporting ATPase subunit epsilon